jgi:hypothetical protein
LGGRIDGVSFGNGEFCAAKGDWSTINTKIVSDGQWLSAVDPSVCNRVQGVAEGRFCWTRQRAAQISVRLPSDMSWQHNNTLCTVGQGDECVVLPAGQSQRVQLLHARTVDGAVNSDIRSQCSVSLGGSPISPSACVIVSDDSTGGGVATPLAAFVTAVAVFLAL